LNSEDPIAAQPHSPGPSRIRPWWGWLGGWGIIAADVIGDVQSAQIAGRLRFLLFEADRVADMHLLDDGRRVLWIAVRPYICYRGIEVSRAAVTGCWAIEVVVRSPSASSSGQGYSGARRRVRHAQHHWLWPSGLSLSADHPGVPARGVHLLGLGHGGRDDEECDGPAKTPGRAAILSTVLLLAIYAGVSISAVAFAGHRSIRIAWANADNSDDVFKATGTGGVRRERDGIGVRVVA